MQQYTLEDFSSTAHECPDCDATFDSEMGVKVHHSKKHDGSLARPVVECANCGTEKRVPSYEHGKYKNHFCDPQCKGEWQKENIAKEDHPSWKGGDIKSTCEMCGDKYRPRPYMEDKTRFCSRRCHIEELAKLQSLRTGSDHQGWKGGVSLYGAVRACLGERSWPYIASEYRDKAGNECEWCGSSGDESRALDVHHIIPIRCGGSHHDDNLMALCRSCHSNIEWFTSEIFDEVLVDDDMRESQPQGGL